MDYANLDIVVLTFNRAQCVELILGSLCSITASRFCVNIDWARSLYVPATGKAEGLGLRAEKTLEQSIIEAAQGIAKRIDPSGGLTSWSRTSN